MFVKACLELQTGPNGSIGAFLCECMSYLSTMEISHFCDVFVKVGHYYLSALILRF